MEGELKISLCFWTFYSQVFEKPGTSTSPNVNVGGLTKISGAGAATAVPCMATVTSGVLAALLVICNVPLLGPTVVG